MTNFEWSRDEYANWVCDMPNGIHLVAAPTNRRMSKFKVRAAPKTTWRAQCSRWDEPTRTLHRFGRDLNWEFSSPEAAKVAAQNIYIEAMK